MGLLDFLKAKPKPAAISEAVYPPPDYLSFRERFSMGLTTFSNIAPFDYLATPQHSTTAIGCFKLWHENPIAARLIEILTDFVLGDGFEIKSANERVQNWADEWTADPSVDLHAISERYINDLLVFGEFPVKPYINEVSGFTRYEPLDVTRISTISMLFGKPYSISAYGLEMRVAHIDKDPRSPKYGGYVGDVLLAQINASTMLSRGYSVLQRLRDWLEAYDEFVFSEIARAIAIRKFLIDWQIEGADKDTIKEYQKKYSTPPEAGTVLFHNEREQINFKTTEINASDSSSLGALILKQVLAGGGIAEHWLAEGGNVNKATAKEMSKPILRRLTRYQALFFRFIEQLIEFARDQAIYAGALQVDLSDPSIDIKIIPDPIDVLDEMTQWTFFNSMIQSLALGITADLVTDGEGREAVVNFLRGMGIRADDLEKETNLKLIDLENRFKEKLEKRKAKGKAK